MDLATFEDGLDRYGSDVATWPDALRSAAAACLDDSSEARAAWRALGEIEGLLRSERPVSGDVARVAARAMVHRQDRLVPCIVTRTGWVLAAAAALAIGLFVGGLGREHEDNPDHVMAAAFDTMGPIDVD